VYNTKSKVSCNCLGSPQDYIEKTNKMADYKKVVQMLGENLASFLELAKKLLVDWGLDPKKLLHLFQNFRKDDLVGLMAGTHEIKVKEHVVAEPVSDDNKFGLVIREFEITVPVDYKHDTQIDSFAKRVKKEKTTYYYNDAFTSKNFAKATNKLVPGKKLKVKIFPILKTAKSEECMTFLKKQNAILAGGQGVTLLYDLAKDQLPKNKWTVSFDEKDALWTDSDGIHRVPGVSAGSDGDFRFYLGVFGYPWDDGNCLACFCD
jgi:hypothetical protein